MTAQSDAQGLFGASLAICRRRVEQIHAVGYCIVNQSVDFLLVYFVFGIFAAAFSLNCGETHAAVAQNRHLLTVRIGTVGHFIGWNVVVCCLF